MLERLSAGALATIVVVTAVVIAPAASVVPAAAQSAPPSNEQFAVAQGTSCTVVTPVTNTSQTVEQFYDYRNPEAGYEDSLYASYGTGEYQESQESVMLFYAGANGTSLVTVNDRLGDEGGGSTITMEFSGLPADGEWSVQDDLYDGQDDDWDIGDTTTVVDWKWAENRTDGGAYRGFGELEGSAVVDPGFNEDAAHWGDWPRSGSEEYRITGWTLKSADGTSHALDMDRRMFVHGGGCVETPPEASVTSPDEAETESSVTFDASATEDDEEIGGYEWDFDGDGEVDVVTTEPTTSRSFAEAGNYTVSVTAFDTYGNGDTDTTTVEVTPPDSPPDATLDAPAETTVNESITLDASGSTDEGNIAEFQWDFDGDSTTDATTSESTTDHTYNESGEFTASVTVVDDDGSEDTATATVNVRPPNSAPTAALDVPATADEGEEVTLDASGSSDDRDIASYEWDFEGDDETDQSTDSSTVSHVYDAGNYTPTVTVVDSDGEVDTANANISVEALGAPPDASLTGPENGTAGEEATFDASNSTAEEGIDSFEWDFDGDDEIDQTTDSATTTHTYETGGTHTATVTVIDNKGQEGTASAPVEVTAPASPPDAALDAPAETTVNESTTLDASGSTDEGELGEFQWDFEGDGEVDDTTESATTEHTYTETGDVEPTVTVVDDDGSEDTATTSMTVTESDSEPLVAELSVTTESPTANEPVSFDASASTPTEDIVSYEWTFDDGESATGETAEHTYEESGTYTVTLEIQSASGDVATTETPVEVAAADSGGDDGGDGNDGGGGDDDSDSENGDDSSNDGGNGDDSDDGDDTNTGGNNAGNSGGSSAGGSTGGSSEPADPAEPDIGPAAVSVSDRTLVAGDSVSVEATLTNAGDAAGERELEFQVDGAVVETQTVAVDANETRTVTFTQQFTTPGERTVSVNGTVATIEVEPAEPDISVARVDQTEDSVLTGETFELTAYVQNTGDAEGTRTVELEMFDEVVAVEEVTVPAGETKEVTFTRKINAPGSYTASVGNATVSLQVDGEDATTTEQPTVTDDSSDVLSPGFGPTVAVLALALAAAGRFVARRKE